MRKLFRILLLASFLWPMAANSQILVDTVSLNTMGELYLGPALSFSKVEYNDQHDNLFEIERKTVGLGLVYKINPSVGLLFQAGHTMKAEYKNSSLEDGKGYMLGAGANFLMYRHNRLSLIGYGLLNFVSDEYKPKKVEMEVTDIHLGLLTAIRGNNVVTFYGGFDLVPYSDGELKYKKYKADVERDDLFNLKLGLDFTLPGVNLKPEVTLFGEKSFTLAASFVM